MLEKNKGIAPMRHQANIHCMCGFKICRLKTLQLISSYHLVIVGQGTTSIKQSSTMD